MTLRKIWTLIVLAISLSIVFAGQTGKISGKIIDAETDEALPGVNIIINELGVGASSSIDGSYFIINIKPGIYTVRFSMIGYAPVTTENVLVAMDQTTQIDLSMTTENLTMDEIRVVATRPAVVKDLSGSQLYVNKATIEAMPVDNISSVVGLQAGVEGVSIRGSGSSQTAFIVDGFQMNDGRSNSPNVTLSLSSVKEIQVQAGGFNAEYGNVRSGVINVVTAEGSPDKYSGTLTYYYQPAAPKNYGISPYDRDSYFLRPYLDDAVAWKGTKGETFVDENGNHEWDSGESFEDFNGDGTWTGWSLSEQDQYTFFEGWNAISLRSLENDDPSDDLTPMEAQREFVWKHRRTGFLTDPDHTLDFGFGGPVPGFKNGSKLRFYLSHRSSNTAFVVPLSRDNYAASTTRLKVNSDINNQMKLTLSLQYSVDESVSPYSWTTTPTGSVLSGVWEVANLVSGGSDVLFMPDYYSPSDLYKTNIGLKFNHMVNQNSFYDVVYQYLHSKYWTFETELRDTSLTEISTGIWRDEAPFGYNAGEWMNLGRDSSIIQTHSLKVDYTNQVNTTNQLKTGVIIKYTDLNIRSFTESDKDTWSRTQVYDRGPFSIAAYVQDKLEYEGFIANVGLRAEYNDPNAPVYAISDYAQQYAAGFGQDIEDDAPTEASKAFWTLSPRLGVSHPITNKSKLYFNYGHFHSTPSSTYRYRLQREFNGQVTSIGNPNLELERTIAYELGYSHSIFEDYLINIATYYKDVSNQSSWVRYTSFYGQTNYLRAENDNYEDIRGIELTLEKIRGDWFSGFINYTYIAQSSGYFGSQVYHEDPGRQFELDKENPQDSRSIPRPYARMNLAFHTPGNFGPKIAGFYPLKNWNMSVLGSYKAGSSTEIEVEGKSERFYLSWVDYYNFNAKLSRVFESEMGDVEFFMDISNLLDTKRLSSTGFSDSRDSRDYYNSLRLPWEEGTNKGNDLRGEYREWDVEYREFVTVEALTDMQGTPASHQIYWESSSDTYFEWDDDTNDWSTMSQSTIDMLVEDKAYIDMPNIRSMTFLTPRQITLGIRIKF